MVRLITSINIPIHPFIDSNAVANTTFTFETDPALSFAMNDKYQIDGRGRQNTVTV